MKISKKISSKIGVFLDIDGVLKVGKRPIPGARDAINLLRKKNIQFVLITNGGGILESEKADEINQVLQLDECNKINENEVVLAHTPLKNISIEHENKTILATGIGNISKILNSYGYKKFLTVEEYTHIYPHSIPSYNNFTLEQINNSLEKVQNRLNIKLNKGNDGKYNTFPIDSVFVVTDVNEWEKNVQVISDIAVSERGVPGTIGIKQDISLFITGNDLVYKSDYVLNRYGVGSFARSLQTLFKENYHRDLNIEFLGKPYAPIFECAKSLIEDHGSKFLYMIGDNPDVDIKGGKDNGIYTILVDTGVYNKHSKNVNHHQPDHNVADVKEAVEMIIKLHNY